MGSVSIDEAVEMLRDFVEKNGVEILNVAGSRGSKDGMIYDKKIKSSYYSTIGNYFLNSRHSFGFLLSV